MSVQARYPGLCPECGERWQPGDLIRTDGAPTGDLPQWQHASCPDTPDPLTTTGPLCERCWCYHPGECT